MGETMRNSHCTFIVAALLLFPAIAFAQAGIAGVVRDSSGAVLPGVTVEAASPALIEKVRTAVTDGSGQYRIIDLRPGTYTVTFTLTGFRNVRREGIQLTGNFTANVSVELALGALEETVTVTGESPLVDIQSAQQQNVLDRQVIDAIPSGRTHFSLATLTPALNTNNPADTGGSNSINLTFLTSHGSRVTDQRITVDGLSTNSAEGGGQYSAYTPNISASQEMAINYAGGTAEMETGGVQVNVIPREGGNRFSGTVFAGGTWSALQGNNFTEDLRARGLPTGNSIAKLWDYNPGAGGPILRDRVWFFSAWRYNGEETYSGGFTNANAGNPNRWDYVLSDEKARFWREQHSLNLRLTWQITPKHKVSGFYDDQWRCACPSQLTAVDAPESATYWHYPWADLQSFTWSSPQTNRLLFEAGVQRHPEQWHSANTGALPSMSALAGGITPGPPGQILQLPQHIQVVEQATGANYRGRENLVTNDMVTWRARAAMSYVTGTHAIKVGYMQHYASRDWLYWAPGGADAAGDNLRYRFNNGVPNQLTQFLRPELNRGVIGRELGIYAQDQITIGRLSTHVGVRYDHLDTHFPETRLGPTRFAPTRDILVPRKDQLAWRDLSPRLSASYDLFGNGRTAVKGILNKYVNAAGLQGFFGDGSNPVNLFANQTSRAWNDVNGNFVPDCDLVSAAANGECGAMLNASFGQPLQTARVDPRVLRGWGTRPFNWELGAGVQHQLTAKVAVDASFFRRWYGNFIAKDNLATTIADYDRFSVTAPADPRLPGGGGYVIPDLYDLKPAKVGQVDNYFTFASEYGEQYENWQGIDVGITTRFGAGMVLQGGVSSGRTVTDNCAVLAVSPEIESRTEPPSALGDVLTTPTEGPYCHKNSGYLTSVKGLGSYVVPRVDIQVSATFQSYLAPAAAGSQITNPIFSMVAANYVATNAVIAPSLGRNLSGGAANATVNLIAPGAVHGDRLQQLDVSVAKILRFGTTRVTAKFDLFNVLNNNAVLTENASYARFRSPTSILQARFARLGLQFDF
jgi:hypothetical protein